MDSVNRLLLFGLIVGLAAAIFLAAGRAHIEDANSTVEIIVDADDVATVAASAGISVSDLLSRLRDAGAAALAVREQTVGDLAESGRLMMLSIPEKTSLITPDGELASAIAPALQERLPRLDIEIAAPPPVISVPMDAADLAYVPVLFPPKDVDAAQKAGLRLVARLRNFPAASSEAVRAAVANAAAQGAELVIFDKEEVLGFDGLIDVTAEALREHDLLFGLVEMAGQRGEDRLASKLAPHIVRVHSISESEMLTMVPAVAVSRYERAVRERNIRALYLRLITRPRASLDEFNVEYVAAVADAVHSKGFDLGAAGPFIASRDWPPQWARALASFAAFAGLLLLLRSLVSIPVGWSLTLIFLGVVAGIGMGALRPTLLVRLSGLAAAVSFPTLGTIWAIQGVRRRSSPLRTKTIFSISLCRLVVASAISLVGALLIVGLHSRPAHFSGIMPFSGVKIALVMPLGFVLAAVMLDLGGTWKPAAGWWARARVRARQWGHQPVTMAYAVVILAALATVALALSRSGNQPTIAPSGFEIKLRGILESVFVVRPRTKEFLFGHPALMLAVALALRGRRTWLPLVALIATLGQVSLLNTFCHFHSPLWLSLARTVNGLWLGALLGAIAILVWRLGFYRNHRLGSI